MARMALYPLFQDIRGSFAPLRAQACVNLRMETPNHFIEAHLYNYERLVVTFEDASPMRNLPDPYRPGWGVRPFVKRGVSVMTIKPKGRTWYSKPDLPQAFEQMQPFLGRFGEILTYGMSMGAFAATTYADLLGARRVLAMSPQSTYRRIDGKGETRYPQIFHLDHSHPYGDAIEGCRKAEEVWVMYDRMDLMDRWHADRYAGPNVRKIELPFSGHIIATMLQEVGALPMAVDLLLTGQIDLPQLYRLCRRRRELTLYVDFIRRVAARHPSVQARLKRILLETGLGAEATSSKNDDSASQTE